MGALAVSVGILLALKYGKRGLAQAQRSGDVPVPRFPNKCPLAENGELAQRRHPRHFPTSFACQITSW